MSLGDLIHLNYPSWTEHIIIIDYSFGITDQSGCLNQIVRFKSININ